MSTSEPTFDLSSTRELPAHVLVSHRPEGDLRAFQVVTESIKTAIKSGDIRPGHELPAERKIADALGVSRPSVREGLRVLEALGIVSITSGLGPSGGVTIRDEPGRELAEVFAMWSALEHVDIAESVAFREAVEGWACTTTSTSSTEGASALRNLDRISREMLSTEDRAEYLELDADFHYEVVRSSGNRLAALVASAVRASIRMHMDRVTAAVGDWEDTRERLTEQHRGIYEALRDGNGETARRRVLEHVRGFYHGHLS